MNFVRILWHFLLHKGFRATWIRFCAGVWGYTHRTCVKCGRYKELDCGSLCDFCVQDIWVNLSQKIDAVLALTEQ